MTAAIFAKSSTQSALQHNGADAVVYEAGGIVSGLGKNKVINGNPLINQRGVSGTVVLAAGIYGHDRWKAGASGCTYTFATSNNVTTLTISAGSLIQVIEGLNLQSGAVVLGWNGTAQGKIDAGSYGASGVTGTAVGGTNMSVEFGAGTLSLVQLETGSIRSNFEQRPYGMELALCQRYYEKSFPQATTPAQNAGTGGAYQWSQTVSAAAQQQAAPVQYVVTKRAIPNVIFYNPLAANSLARNNSVAADCSTTTIQLSNERMFGINITAAAGSALGQTNILHYTADAEI